MKQLHSRFQIGWLGFDQVAERRDVDAHSGSSGDEGGSKCEAPHAGVSRQVGCTLPQQRGRLLAHHGWGSAEQVGYGVISDSPGGSERSEEHTSELQSRLHLVCRLLLEKKKTIARSTRDD